MLKIVVMLILLNQYYADQRLQVLVYIEAQHSECNNFITNSVKKTLNISDIDKILQLIFVPYGDTKRVINPPGFFCGHTKVGCYGNRIQACAFRYFNLSKSQRQQVEWLVCMESDRYYTETQFDQAHMVCGKDLMQDQRDAIHKCTNGFMGSQLQEVLADWTGKLQPPHTYLPWITVNGQHDVAKENEIISDLVQWACRNYQGDIKLDACKNY